MEDLFELFDLFEVQPEGRLWRGAVNGRETASSKLAELSAKSGKPVFAMNLQTREILEAAPSECQAPQPSRNHSIQRVASPSPAQLKLPTDAIAAASHWVSDGN
jgi:hypothetical protein